MTVEINQDVNPICTNLLSGPRLLHAMDVLPLGKILSNAKGQFIVPGARRIGHQFHLGRVDIGQHTFQEISNRIVAELARHQADAQPGTGPVIATDQVLGEGRIGKARYGTAKGARRLEIRVIGGLRVDAQGIEQIPVRFHGLRVEHNGAVKTGNSVSQASLRHQDSAKITEVDIRIRLDQQGRPVAGSGLHQPAQVLECPAQIVLRHDQGRTQS